MKIKAFFYTMLVILSFLVTSSYKVSALEDYVIAIDAGHGGYDPGALEGEYRECDINLEISKALANIFTSNGYKVIMTRERDMDFCNDVYIKRNDINKRINILNESMAKICISIHLNAYSNSKYYGAQVFYANSNTNNKKLAEEVQNSLGYYLGTTRKAVKRDNIYLLNKLYSPSILVECGFMTNKEELRLMIKKEYQYMIAYAIYRGILAFNIKEKEAA